jgi:hypothetical protein
MRVLGQGSDRSLESMRRARCLCKSLDGRVLYRSSRDTMLIDGRFGFDRSQTSILLDPLPPVLAVRAKSTQASILPWIPERLLDELSTAKPGVVPMVNHLAHMLFVRVLPAYLAWGNNCQVVGWAPSPTQGMNNE